MQMNVRLRAWMKSTSEKINAANLSVYFTPTNEGSSLCRFSSAPTLTETQHPLCPRKTYLQCGFALLGYAAFLRIPLMKWDSFRQQNQRWRLVRVSIHQASNLIRRATCRQPCRISSSFGYITLMKDIL